MKKKQIVLPDLTGLSVAVESPAKGQSHQAYEDTRKENGDDEGHGMSLAAGSLSWNSKRFSPFAARRKVPPNEDRSPRRREPYVQETHEGA